VTGGTNLNIHMNFTPSRALRPSLVPRNVFSRLHGCKNPQVVFHVFSVFLDSTNLKHPTVVPGGTLESTVLAKTDIDRLE
jgi:hypothetical protein